MARHGIAMTQDVPWHVWNINRTTGHGIPWIPHGGVIVMSRSCIVMPWSSMAIHGHAMVIPWLCHGSAVVVHGSAMDMPWACTVMQCAFIVVATVIHRPAPVMHVDFMVNHGDAWQCHGHAMVMHV